MVVQRLENRATPPLSAMIVDSDLAAVRRFKAVILKDKPRIVVAGTAHSVAQAREQAARQKPDVVFIDPALADGEGVNLARHLAPEQAIVVVTDRPDYAIAAFQFGAVDYLLKPLTAPRLRETLRRLERLFDRVADSAAAAAAPPASQPAFIDRVTLASRALGQKTTDLVSVTDIVWIESLQNYSIVQLPGRERRQMRRTLTEWEALLPAAEFVRIGRSHLIQIGRIRAISSPSRNEWLVQFLDVDRPLQLGRAAAGKLKAILRGSLPA